MVDDPPVKELVTSPTAAGGRRRLPRHRLVLLLGGGLGLLLGMYTGLARGGTPHRLIAADLHGLLMALGFLGTLIALERAVALGRPWGYLGPAMSGAAVIVLPFSRATGGLLLAGAGAIVLATYLALFRRGGRDLHLLIMAIGALAWVAAVAVWFSGAGPIRTTPLLAAFLVLTIVGERLDLSRLTSSNSRQWFLLAVAAFAVGAALAPFWRPAGLTLGGIGLLGQVAWLGRYDLARSTIRRPGLPRFAAICVLAGYVWLGVSGVLWIAIGLGTTGPLLHDALVHALFLGFVLSMVMGHAPIIVAAVLRVPLHFVGRAYLPLALLHGSVAVRIAADLAGSTSWRQAALHGNVAALVLFVVIMVTTLRAAGRRPSPVPA